MATHQNGQFSYKSPGNNPQLTNYNYFSFGNDTLRPGDSEYQVIFWIQQVVVVLLAIQLSQTERVCFGEVRASQPLLRGFVREVANMVGGQPGG